MTSVSGKFKMFQSNESNMNYYLLFMKAGYVNGKIFKKMKTGHIFMIEHTFICKTYICKKKMVRFLSNNHLFNDIYDAMVLR